jgi:hypothetical protein
MYDAGGNVVNSDELAVGDVAYDEHGDSFVVQQDGSLLQDEA